MLYEKLGFVSSKQILHYCIIKYNTVKYTTVQYTADNPYRELYVHIWYHDIVPNFRCGYKVGSQPFLHGIGDRHQFLAKIIVFRVTDIKQVLLLLFQLLCIVCIQTIPHPITLIFREIGSIDSDKLA